MPRKLYKILRRIHTETERAVEQFHSFGLSVDGSAKKCLIAASTLAWYALTDNEKTGFKMNYPKLWYSFSGPHIRIEDIPSIKEELVKLDNAVLALAKQAK